MHPFVNIAVDAARNAGKTIMRHFENLSPNKISEKGLNDLVTEVDMAAEKTIIHTIQKSYPNHSILAEESGSHPGSLITWVIDPIDGTMNFVHGFPQFAVSIGIMERDQLEHAVIYDPFGQELFTASRGSGAQLNNRRIRVSEQASLRNALLAADLCFEHADERLQEKHIALLVELYRQGADMRKNGSAALNLAYMAAGRIDGFFESGLKPWDMAAGILLVREAGGFVSDYAGENDYFKNGTIVAGTRKIYTDLFDHIKASSIPSLIL